MILQENKFFCTFKHIYNCMKSCCECKIIKPLNKFNKNKNLKDGLNNRCKVCCSKRNKLRYENKKNIIKQQTNLYYHNNKENVLLKLKEKPSYHKTNPEYYKEYRKNNKPSYSLRIQVWWWIRKKGLEKNKKTENLLGYSFNDFEQKIGKPLNNQQLDHKIPLSWFKEETPINILFNLENLHYINADLNKSKSNSFSHPVSENYKNIIKEYIKDKYKNKLWK